MKKDLQKQSLGSGAGNPQCHPCLENVSAGLVTKQVADIAANNRRVKSKVTQLTTAPIEAGNFSGVLPEFGRYPDVQRHFGVKRGIAYRWIRAGFIKSVVIRTPGARSGIRLIYMQSVRDFINAKGEVAS